MYNKSPNRSSVIIFVLYMYMDVLETRFDIAMQYCRLVRALNLVSTMLKLHSSANQWSKLFPGEHAPGPPYRLRRFPLVQSLPMKLFHKLTGMTRSTHCSTLYTHPVYVLHFDLIYEWWNIYHRSQKQHRMLINRQLTQLLTFFPRCLHGCQGGECARDTNPEVNRNS
jgi:hypothetical protein